MKAARPLAYRVWKPEQRRRMAQTVFLRQIRQNIESTILLRMEQWDRWVVPELQHQGWTQEECHTWVD